MNKIFKSLERFFKRLLWDVLIIAGRNHVRESKIPAIRDIKTLLIIRADGKIGNMVLTLPLFNAFRNIFPRAKISVLTAPNQAPILDHNPFVNEVIPIAFGDIFARPIRAIRLFRKIRNPDLVLECSNPGSLSVSHALLLVLAGGRYRMGFARGESERLLNLAVPLNQEQHYRDIMLDLARFLNPDVSVRGDLIFLSPEEKKEGYGLVGEIRNHRGDIPVIGIWVGARHEKKWATENYARLGERLLAETGAESLFLFGPEEGADYEEFNRQYGRNARRITDIRKLASILYACELIICGDTGPLHLAAALNKPTISLFNYRNANIYGYEDGIRFRSVFLPDFADPVSDIVRISQEILKTAACGEHA